MGVPMSLITVAENQKMIVSGLCSGNMAIDLGWFEVATETGIERVLERLMADKRFRYEMASKGRALVDGQGPIRVASLMRNEE